MKAWLAVILIVAALSPAYAVDTLTFDNCDNLGIERCDEFNQINISKEEQKKLLSSLLEIKSNQNIHEFIFNWNTNLVFDEIPYDIIPVNESTIKNAWLIISSIMPTVLYENTLYNNLAGHVLINYGYDLTRPDTYFNGAWNLCSDSLPISHNEGEEGDCRTEYPENWDLSYLDTYQNGAWLGNETLLPFNSTADQNGFASELSIINKIQRDHFEWVTTTCCQCNDCCWECGMADLCCGEDCDRCGCNTYLKECIFSDTDYRIDELWLTAEKTSYLQQYSYSRPLILFDEAKGIARCSINSTNIDKYAIALNEIQLSKNNFDYSYNITHAPANVLTAQANKVNKLNSNVYAEIESIGEQDLIAFHYSTNQTYNCTLNIAGFFNESSVDCDLSILPKTELNITTAKFFYLPGEIIKVNVTITSEADTSNDAVNFSYGNQTFNLVGNSNLEIPAKIGFNQFRAEYKTGFTHQSAIATKTINVYSGEKLKVYSTILWFIVFFIGMFTIIRMCWVKYHGVKN